MSAQPLPPATPAAAPGAPPVGRLVLVPALITLAITGLRLAGELLDWSPRYFSREAGGGAALVGIVWLVPVFGAWFAVKLVQAGHAPASAGRAAALAFAGFLFIPLAIPIARGLGIRMPLTVLAFGVFALAGAALAWRGWPALGRTLLAYGLAARVPVAALMFVAMLAQWGTHYEKGPPGFPQMGTLATWFWIGLLPQLTLWIGFTLSVGALFGAAAAAIARRR